MFTIYMFVFNDINLSGTLNLVNIKKVELSNITRIFSNKN